MAEEDVNSSEEFLDRARTVGDEVLLSSALQRMTFEEQAHSEHFLGESRDSSTNAENGTDVFEHMEKIRRVLSLDQPENGMDGRGEPQERQWAHYRRETRRMDQADQTDPEMVTQDSQADLQEHADRHNHQQQQLFKDDSGGDENTEEGACMGSRTQNSEASKSTTETSVPIAWKSSVIKKTDAEAELDRLACQVQYLVHQLTICQQNLVKAEREVSMLHDENRQFRSLIRDIQGAFWTFDSDAKH